jgi:hypothetical protein
MPSTTSNRPTARLPRMPDPAIEAEWNWPRPPVSQVECVTRSYTSERQAARSGFLQGVGSIFDLLGVLPFVFFRRIPHEDDAEALTEDWMRLRGDLVIVHERLHGELTARWPEHDWPARQGTLFDAEEFGTHR